MATADVSPPGERSVSGVAKRYATALYELASDDKVLEPVSADLTGLARLVAESPDLLRLIRSPMFTREEQARAMGAILDAVGVQPLTRRFVLFLASQRRLFALPDIARAIAEMLARDRGEMTARVTSASPLAAGQIAALKASLKAAFGRDVQLQSSLDASLIGGLVVRVGSRMIDSSLKTKLQNLAQAMKGA